MKQTVGKKIKRLRTRNKITLKELSSKSNLSVGFLSQLERGLTSIAIDTLENIADIFNVEMSYFFDRSKDRDTYVMRSHEKRISPISEEGSTQYYLSKVLKNKNLIPRYIILKPGEKNNDVLEYEHEGEEFIYILEGILTLTIDGSKVDLYPEDSAHYLASISHNWINNTNRLVKILVINTPNYLLDDHGDLII